jgi:hypothetical protein
MRLDSLPARLLDEHELRELVDGLARQPEVWDQLVAFRGDSRHFVSLHRDEYVDAWLICWGPSDDTGWHDHDVSCGAVHVAERDGSAGQEAQQITGRDHVVAGHGHVLVLAPDRQAPAFRQRQRQCDSQPVLLVTPSHPPASFFFEAAVQVGGHPLDRQALDHRQEQPEVEPPPSRQFGQPFQHLVTNVGRGEDRRRLRCGEDNRSSATDRRRQDDVGVSDERAGKPGNRS